ncbi:MAG: YdgA family protein [Thermodesulfobacteriota bacterium]
MRRVIIVIVLIVVLALFGLPYWFGIRTEKVYNDIIDTYSGTGNVSIVEKSYEKGWLNSRAKTTFVIKNGDAELIKLEETDTIYHGPFPVQAVLSGLGGLTPVMAVIDSKLVLVPADESEFSNFIKKLPPASLLTRLSMDGGGITDITMPGIESEQGEEGEKLKWQGLTGDVKFSPEFKDVDTELKSPGLNITGKESDVSVTGIAADSRLKYVGPENKYPVGDINFTVAEVAIRTKDESSGGYDNFSITGIELTGTSTESEGLLNSTHSLGFRELDAGGGKYGPGGYELAIRNIDMESWIKIQELLKNNQKAPQTEEQRQIFMTELMKIVPGLIKKSPEIELTKLNIMTADGSIDGHLKISVDGTGMDNPELASNPLFLIAAIKADARVAVTKSLLETIITDYKKEEITDDFRKADDEVPPPDEIAGMAKEEMGDEIKGLMDQGIITESADNYEINASYDMGQVTLNGQPLDMQSLIGD